MGVSLDGLVSGLNTSDIIKGLVGAAGAGLTKIKSQKADVELKKDHWSTLKGYLEELKTAIEAVNADNELKGMTATSADTSLVFAEVSGNALAGTYKVDVTQEAQAQTSKSNQTWADGSTTFSASGAPTLDISINGGAATTVAITDNTLDGAISAINDANLGIQAYKVFDSTAGEYRLMITSEQTGADYDFSITPDGGTTLTFTDIATAADMKATVNGVDVASATNVISGVIPGVTLTAYGLTGGDIDVTVGIDRTKTKTNITSFVDKYNQVMSYMSYELKFNDASQSAGPLSGDGTLRTIQSKLQSLVRDDYTTNDIDSLTLMGITTKSDGTLEVDDTKLGTALDDTFSQVMDFFTSSSGIFAAFTTSVSDGALDYILDTTDGTVQNKIDALDSQIESYTDAITREEDRLAKLEQSLRDKFTALEVTLSKLKLSEAYVENLSSLKSSSKK